MKFSRHREADAPPPVVPPVPAAPSAVSGRRHCPDTRPATAPGPAAEQRARLDVHARLARRFPAVPAPVVERVADEEFAFFATARIRHYVPVLVLRRAGERLAEAAAAAARQEGLR